MYLAIDQGTTSTRALLFDREFKLVADARRALDMFYPQNGWVEQEAEQLWQTVQDVAGEVLEKAQIKATDVAGIGITNQRETTVIWERKTAKPVFKAIVWQDRRTADYCRELKKAGHEKLVREKSGLLLDPYFSATKLRWILREVPDGMARAKRGELAFGTVDSWLLFKMTGDHLTDVTNASRTLLFDIHKQDWSDELLALFEIPRAVLPEVRDCHAAYGKTDLLGAATPICGVAGDQHAATFGQTCFKPGMVKSTYGTGCFALMNTGDKPYLSEHRLLTTPAYRIKGKMTYALEGSIFMAGASVQWLRDGLNLIDKAPESEAVAKSVDDNGGVFLVPAFTGLGAPYWEPQARGAIFGMTRNTSAAHIVRATLEAVAYQTQDLLQAMHNDCGALSELRVDGGMVGNAWLMSFLADQLGVTVRVPSQMETTALGVAYLTALELGHFSNETELAPKWREEAVFTPGEDREAAEARYQKWQWAVAQVIHSVS